jgi:uncharacterized protein
MPQPIRQPHAAALARSRPWIRALRRAVLAFSLMTPCVALCVTEPQLRRSGFLGVQVAPVPDALRSSAGLPEKGGVVIVGLVEGGSAGAAGLREGDIVLAANDMPVEGPGGFVRFVSGLRAGDQVELRAMRAGVQENTRVTIRPRPSESVADVQTDYRAVAVDGAARRTIVTRPRAPGRHPAILYMTGIGCFSQESLGAQSTEAQLLYGLTRAGYVTMRVEKTGVGDSQGPACDADIADLRMEVRGYVAGLEALRDYDFVDRDRIFLLGLSIGGVDAPLVAQQGSVRGVVVINTVARPFMDYLQEIRRTQAVLHGTPYDVIDANLHLNQRCNYRMLVDREAPASVVKTEPKCADYIEYPAPPAYMRQWADLNLAAEWKRVNAPVLILHGQYDFVASPVDATYLRDIVESFHPGRATFQSIANMDHTLAHVTSWPQSLARMSGGGEANLAGSLLSTLTGWLRDQAP